MPRTLISTICFLMATSAMAEATYTGPGGLEEQAVAAPVSKKLVVLKKVKLSDQISEQDKKSLENMFKVLNAERKDPALKGLGSQGAGSDNFGSSSRARFRNIRLTDETAAKPATGPMPVEPGSDGRR